MSRHTDNLGRAARLLQRVNAIGGPDDFEGVPVREIVGDVLMAQNRAILDEGINRINGFSCNVDESAGMAEVVSLEGYVRKVPCA